MKIIFVFLIAGLSAHALSITASAHCELGSPATIDTGLMECSVGTGDRIAEITQKLFVEDRLNDGDNPYYALGLAGSVHSVDFSSDIGYVPSSFAESSLYVEETFKAKGFLRNGYLAVQLLKSVEFSGGPEAYLSFNVLIGGVRITSDLRQENKNLLIPVMLGVPLSIQVTNEMHGRPSREVAAGDGVLSTGYVRFSLLELDGLAAVSAVSIPESTSVSYTFEGILFWLAVSWRKKRFERA